MNENVLKKGFNTIVIGIFSILEYNELDLVWFLSLKKRFWYYKPLLYFKFTLIILYIVFLFLINFFLLFFNIQLVIINLIILIIYLIIDYLYFKNFKYSLWYYRKRKEFLNRIHNQIKLLINNQVLFQKLKEEVIEFKKNLPDLSKRITSFSGFIKSYRTYLEKYSYLIAIVVPFISFFIPILYQFDINLSHVEIEFFSENLINLYQFIISLSFFGVIIVRINHNRIQNTKTFIIYSEALLEVILLSITSMLKILEFGDEKEKGNKLKKDISQWINNDKKGLFVYKKSNLKI